MVFAVPSNIRYKKAHKIKPAPLLNNKSQNFYSKKELRFFCPKFCDFYLKALRGGTLNAKQVESVRRAIKRALKKNVFLKINIFLYAHMTKKPISARMGKGKGKPYKWVAPIYEGKSLFEFKKLTGRKLTLRQARLLMKILPSKLSIKARIYKLKY